MEEKKGIKVSLSAFFLILAIIAIIVMAFFLLKFYTNNTTQEKQVASLSREISNLKATMENNSSEEKEVYKVNAEKKEVFGNTTEQTPSKEEINYASLKGVYVGDIAERASGATKVYLNLCDNGCFAYYYVPDLDIHYEGYYFIDGDKLILHALLDCGNDPGATVIDKTITIQIKDGTILTDTDELKTTLSKTTDEYYTDINLTNSIKSRLEANMLR